MSSEIIRIVKKNAPSEMGGGWLGGVIVILCKFQGSNPQLLSQMENANNAMFFTIYSACASYSRLIAVMLSIISIH